MRAPILPALVLVSVGLGTTSASGITAPDARTKSFKLQTEGMRLYKEGKYREATEAFQQVVNINLNSFLAYYYLGVCLIAERRYGESLEPLKIALDLQPDYIQAHLALGDAYLKQGDAAEARAEYLRTLDLQPNYAAAHDGLGRLFESTGQDDKAEAEYRKALEINVAFADSYTHLGDLFLRRDRLDDAIDLFLKAIAVRPDFGSAYTRLGTAYARLHLYNDAIAATRRSQELSPQDPEPCVELARIYLDLQSDRRVEAAIQAALALDRDNAAAHLALSALKRRQEDFAAAEEVLQELRERGIEDAQMRKAVGEALKKLQADIPRYAALKEAAGKSPPDPNDLVTFGRFLAVQGAHRRAAELLEQAAALQAPPEASATRLEEANELLAARLDGRAIDLYEQLGGPQAAGSTPAGDGEPVRAAARFNLGVARASLGLYEEAAQAFSAYLLEHPGEPQALLYLGNAYLRLGRKADARAAYAAFLAAPGAGAEAAQVQKVLKTLPQAPRTDASGGTAASGPGGGAE